MYHKKSIDPAKIAKSSGPILWHSLQPILHRSDLSVDLRRHRHGLLLCLRKWFDTCIIDGFLDCVANVTKWAGAKLRKTETGNMQTYAVVMFFLPSL